MKKCVTGDESMTKLYPKCGGVKPVNVIPTPSW
jgi:hypothetical protein